MCYISKIKRSKQANNKQMTRKITNVWQLRDLEPRSFTHTHTHKHKYTHTHTHTGLAKKNAHLRLEPEILIT
jgi:ABC-type Zn2+ transport system substrate-binding protein/surface adhesin